MDKPVMMGEQTNVPKNEEELAAALARKAAADAVEQKAHEAARRGTASQQARIMAADNGLFSALWDLAEATGTINHHINAVLFTTAVIIANAKTHGEQVKIIEYISTTAAELKAKAKAPEPNPQEQSNGN